LLSMKWLALVLVAGLALAGCGGSMHTSTSGNTAAAQAQIKSAYQKFFSGQTSISDRAAVLQDGSKFKSVIQAFASNPLAKNVNVTVSSVKLQGADRAKVVYIVKLGSAGLPKQTGTAVLQNGSWKVGDASLCKLVSLQGSTPSACKS
jgi:ABC-type glycerol-3-phosphate transport system substrate-binding protein